MARSHHRRKVSNKIRIHKISPAFLYKIRRKLYQMRENAVCPLLGAQPFCICLEPLLAQVSVAPVTVSQHASVVE